MDKTRRRRVLITLQVIRAVCAAFAVLLTVMAVVSMWVTV